MEEGGGGERGREHASNMFRMSAADEAGMPNIKYLRGKKRERGGPLKRRAKKGDGEM